MQAGHLLKEHREMTEKARAGGGGISQKGLGRATAPRSCFLGCP